MASSPLQCLQRLRQRLPPIHHDRLTRDKPCLFGGEERHRVPDLLHRAQALQRDRSGHRLDVCLAQVTDPFGQHIARQDGVNSDLESCQLNGGSAHESQHPGFGCPIVRPARVAREGTRDGRREHDAARRTFLYVGQGGFDAEQHTLEVRRKHVVPGALAHLLQLYCWKNASVCTENVYPTKFGGYRRHDLFHIPCSLTSPRPSRNTTGSNNMAVGYLALSSNVDSFRNNAVGVTALSSHITGNFNNAVGTSALFSDRQGQANNAFGDEALYHNTAGAGNTAIGDRALSVNTTGVDNTAIGASALPNSTGTGNIALGVDAGDNVITANNVICIGTTGRNVSNSCYIGNIFATTVGEGAAVVIDGSNQLGTVVSSRRYK